MPTPVLFIVAFALGIFIASSIFAFNWYSNYSDHGGSILIDEESGVYRIILNDDIENWGDQDYVILKVSKTEQRLRRLKDIDRMSLEDRDEDK